MILEHSWGCSGSAVSPQALAVLIGRLAVSLQRALRRKDRCSESEAGDRVRTEAVPGAKEGPRPKHRGYRPFADIMI